MSWHREQYAYDDKTVYNLMHEQRSRVSPKNKLAAIVKRLKAKHEAAKAQNRSLIDERRSE